MLWRIVGIRGNGTNTCLLTKEGNRVQISNETWQTLLKDAGRLNIPFMYDTMTDKIYPAYVR